jgi:hypothetical protein
MPLRVPRVRRVCRVRADRVPVLAPEQGIPGNQEFAMTKKISRPVRRRAGVRSRLQRSHRSQIRIRPKAPPRRKARALRCGTLLTGKFTAPFTFVPLPILMY